MLYSTPACVDSISVLAAAAVVQAYEREDDAALARAILALYRGALLTAPHSLRLLPQEAAKGPRSLRAEQDRRREFGAGELVWVHNQASAEGVVPKGSYATHYGPCWVRDSLASAEHSQDWVIYRTSTCYHIARLAGCVARVFFGGWPAHKVIFWAVKEYDALLPAGPGGWPVALPIIGGMPLEMVEL